MALYLQQRKIRVQSRYLGVLQNCQNFPAHVRSGRMWLHHVLVSREEHPTFPSDREFPNFSGVVGYLKVYISIPESCSSLPAHETCHRARGGCCCHRWSAMMVLPKQAEFGNRFCKDVSSGPCHGILLSLETMEANSDLICKYCYCCVIEIDNKSLTSFHG